MPITLARSVAPSSGILCLAAEGEATGASLDANPFPLDTILGADCHSHIVIMDMDRVTYLNSAAIGHLISLQKSFKIAGGKLILHSLQPQIRQLLNMLKIERIIAIAPDAAAAQSMAPHSH